MLRGFFLYHGTSLLVKGPLLVYPRWVGQEMVRFSPPSFVNLRIHLLHPLI